MTYYLTGSFNSSLLNFYNSTRDIDISFNPISSFDTYIAKYDPSGTVLWIRQNEGTSTDSQNHILTDNTNVYIEGNFNGIPLKFYNSTGDIDISLIPIGEIDIYIAKYDPSGTLLWVRLIEGAWNDTPVSILTDNTNVYVTGYFNGSLDFYNSTGDIDISLNSEINQDTYIAKYDSSGIILWVRQISGSGNETPVSILIDNTNTYIKGNFTSSLDFYNSTGGIDISLNSEINQDTYIAKYDPSGTVLWVRQNGGTSADQPISACISIIQNPISNICFLGGTSIMTDQGIIEIENITNDNTINNIRVKYITRITSNDEYLVSIEKDSISENVPSKTTVITRNHKILYNENLIEEESIPNIKIIKYNGELLYNVLLEKNSFMNVHNLICDTLDVNNIISLLYDHPNKNEITNY